MVLNVPRNYKACYGWGELRDNFVLVLIVFDDLSVLVMVTTCQEEKLCGLCQLHVCQLHSVLVFRLFVGLVCF